MADQKLTSLSAATSAAATDIIYLVVDPGGTPLSRKITIANLFTSPALTTPNIGVATATSVNKVTITAPAISATLTIADGKTLTASNTITLAAGADGQTFTFPASGGTVTVLGNSTTGTGDIVRATSPTLVTPVIGVATATSVNKITITAPATGATLTIADGKTATVNSTLTLAGTDGTTITFQGTDTYVGRATTDTLTNKTLTTPVISGAISFPDNIRQTFNPGADAAGLNVGSVAGDPGTPSNGDLWYDSTGNLLRARVNAATITLGSASPAGSDTHVQFNDGGTFGGNAGLVYNKTNQALTITPAANNVPLTLTGLSLTGANAQSVVDIVGTWNTTGTPSAIKANITDTASNAASLLLNLQVGGASKFTVDKTGVVKVRPDPGTTAFSIGSTSGAEISIGVASTGPILRLANSDGNCVTFDAQGNQFNITSVQGSLFNMVGALISWSSAASSDPDIALWRPEAGILRVTAGAGDNVGKLRYGRSTLNKTADYTVLNTDSHTLFTNIGAVGAVIFTLPTPAAGLTYEFYRDANQTVTVDIGAGVTIRVGASVTTDGGNVTLDAVGSRLRLVAISTTQWIGDLSGTATFN